LLNPDKITQRFDNYGKLSCFINFSYTYGLLKKFDNSRLFSSKSINLDPSERAYYLNKGASLSGFGRKEEAIVEYDKAIEINPQDALAYDGKGCPLFLLGRINEAIVSSTKSIRLDENYANAWYNRSVYYSHEDKIEVSLLDLQKALTVNKKYGYDALKDKDFDNVRNNPKFIGI
jgi:tetratricopeptide (TPR) repeat protein